MKRLLLFVALLAFVPSVALGKRAASRSPVQSAAVAEIVLIGTVVEIEKEMIETKDKMTYTVANVKVSETIRGLKDVTNIKVGFTPNARVPLNLAEKGEYLLFLTKHPTGNFYVMNWMSPPLAVTADTKATVDDVKAVGKILADPAKALKAEKAEDKALAAIALILHYRSPSESGAEQTLEAVPLELSRSILKGFGSVDWSEVPQLGGVAVMTAFYQLGLGEKEGWKQPEIKPGENAANVLHKAYTDWLAGPGAKHQIQKFVAKKQ